MSINTEKLLQQLLQDVSEIKAKLNAMIANNIERQTANEKKLDDHEKRLRFLERGYLYIIGALSFMFILFEIYRTFLK